MKITLKKKNDPSDKDPLIVQYVEGEEKSAKKVTVSVAIGESLDLPDDIAFDVMGRYKGMFALGDAANVSEKMAGAAFQGKSLKNYQDKAAQSSGQ